MTKNKLFSSSINFNFFVGVVFVICVSLIIGLVITAKASKLVDENIAENEEAARPAELEIIILQDFNCSDCFDLTLFIETLKKENVQVNSEKVVEISSLEGEELIELYAIDKVPTFIIKGEIEKDQNLKKIWPQIGDIQEGVFIFRQVMTPYILTSTGEVKGRGKLTMLTDEVCKECYDVTVHEKIMARFGFPIANAEILDVSSPSGQTLVTQYGIILVPTVVLTGDMDEYSALVSVWEQVGTIEDANTYIFRDGVRHMGVYKNLITNEVLQPVNPN